jgi:hypothetical protein
MLANFISITITRPWEVYIFGVAEKHDFRGTQRKIPQKSNFAQKQDLNPIPHWTADIAKMF